MAHQHDENKTFFVEFRMAPQKPESRFPHKCLKKASTGVNMSEVHCICLTKNTVPETDLQDAK